MWELLLVRGGRANSWYHSGNSTLSTPRPSQKSGKSDGERSICFPASVTTKAKGKRHM